MIGLFRRDKRRKAAGSIYLLLMDTGVKPPAPVSSSVYEDALVKTAQGWRFKTRNVITRQEQAAGFTAKDFIALRQLAGSEQGKFDDVYRETPVGRRLRSAGLVIAVAADGATGRAYLRNDGGHYDDIYARSSGGWRFQSRTYVTGDTLGTQASAGR